MSSQNPALSNLLASLQAHFGFASFRPGQTDAIKCLLEGKNTLAVMPTGAGKSLIFQLAALQLDGLTLVISPLIALMKDQVDGLSHRDIAATYINSSLPAAEQNRRLEQLGQGKFRIVYISPERLRSVPFLEALRTQHICLLAVDEAHCISEWGHDFRPDYLYIARWRDSVSPCAPLTVALTATATPQVQDDIIRLLGLGKSTARIVTGFNRPNLTLNVLYTNGLNAKLRALNMLLSSRQAGANLMYTGTRREAEEAAEFLREVVHIPAEHYHAGLPAEERIRIQEAFITGALDCVAATNAFGMGIDRADVRQVIHFSMPGSLEAYYQEAGRAGRDGIRACATLLYDPQDRALQEFFIENSVLGARDLEVLYQAMPPGKEIWSTTDELSRITSLHPVQIKVGLAELERAGALVHLGDEGLHMLFRRGQWDQSQIEKAAANSKQHVMRRQKQLDRMINYAESNACRRKIILNHFGDTGPAEADECCDNCQVQKTAPATPRDIGKMDHAERAALIILDCIRRLRIKVGRAKIAQILGGSKAQDILKFHYDQTVYYGRLEALKQSQIEDMVDQLIDKRYIKVIGGEYPVVSLSPTGEEAVRLKAHIALRLPKGMSSQAIQRKQAQKQAGSTADYTLELLGKGMTPEQIASQRELAVATIYSHCARLIEEGKLGLERVVSPEVYRQIDTAIQRAGSTQALTPIKEFLPDEIDYNMIRCVVAHQKAASVETFLSKSHPRPLNGLWQAGWSLGFHSRFAGSEWSRSGVGDLTYRLKYEADASVLPELIQHTLDLFAAHPEMTNAEVITPVPPSAKREVEPVFTFCDALARQTGKPLLPALIKTRATRPQKELTTLAQKRANVCGAFALTTGISGRRILLVDDLFDSGATLNEITRLLLDNGAARVNVLTLTRTIHSDL